MTEQTPLPATQRSDRRSQKALGGTLARLYASVAEAPAPDEFLRLLEAADLKSRPPEGSQ